MAERLLMKGNEAVAEAAILAGCIHFFGYPITPQTEVAAYMSKRLPKIEGGVYLQAESEIAAANMVLGASAAGVRAMTSSSSPGISLKTECISYMAGSDIPCLIVNVQRAGPGLGGIQPSQADYWQATRGLGHGGAHALVFAPSSIQEMVDMVFDGFELAEQYRIPAIILSDGLLGQMMEPVIFPERKPKYIDKPWALTGHGFKREHNIVNSLYLEASELEEKNNEREQRYNEIRRLHAVADSYLMEDASVAVVAYGAAARVSGAAIDVLREQGVKAGLIRPVTLWPFPTAAIESAAEQLEQILVVEMSHGQMVEDVRLAVNGKIPVHFYGRNGGILPTQQEIINQLLELTGGVK
ncbi:MAG: 3-methyl-2-oxobutanoate dehydrogenase subunit VorB [Oscillospiraceae bacterium]|nr:3-methyl-2-oxobutanoate dehydrogenase subunit VorB [Oscillospiraceae bacterium]